MLPATPYIAPVPDPYAHPRPPPAAALSVRRVRVAAGAQLRIPSQPHPPPGGTRPPHASGRRSTPATRAGRATPARRHAGTPAPGNRGRRRFGRTVPVAQRQEPHRRLDRRQRVTLTDVDVAVVNLHRQLPEPVIGHARSALHVRRIKSGSPTVGQPLRSALLPATPTPPAPRAARSIAVHGHASQLTELPPSFPEPRVGLMRRLQPGDLHPLSQVWVPVCHSHRLAELPVAQTGGQQVEAQQATRLDAGEQDTGHREVDEPAHPPWAHLPVGGRRVAHQPIIRSGRAEMALPPTEPAHPRH